MEEEEKEETKEETKEVVKVVIGPDNGGWVRGGLNE